jgi:hypothetical protein
MSALRYRATNTKIQKAGGKVNVFAKAAPHF